MAKDELVLYIRTGRVMRDVSYAEQLIQLMNEAGIQWDRISDVEPIRNEYSDERFYKYWQKAHKLSEDGASPVYYASFLCAQKDRKINLSVSWHTERGSDIFLKLKHSYMKKNYAAIYNLFLQLILSFQAEFAFIMNRQYWLHNPQDTIVRRVPFADCVGWITYFPDKAILAEKEKLLVDVPHQVTDCLDGAVLTLGDHVPKDKDSIEEICNKLFPRDGARDTVDTGTENLSQGDTGTKNSSQTKGRT